MHLGLNPDIFLPIFSDLSSDWLMNVVVGQPRDLATLSHCRLYYAHCYSFESYYIWQGQTV